MSSKGTCKNCEPSPLRVIEIWILTYRSRGSLPLEYALGLLLAVRSLRREDKGKLKGQLHLHLHGCIVGLECSHVSECTIKL